MPTWLFPARARRAAGLVGERRSGARRLGELATPRPRPASRCASTAAASSSCRRRRRGGRAGRAARHRARCGRRRSLVAPQVVPGHGCHWVFYDGSRNRSGAWCSMRICGNRPRRAPSVHARREGIAIVSSGGYGARGWRGSPERSRRARLAAPLRVARSRLSAGRGRAALVVAGVAVATAAGVGLTAGSLLAQDLAVRRAATTDVGGLLRVDAAICPRASTTTAPTPRRAGGWRRSRPSTSRRRSRCATCASGARSYASARSRTLAGTVRLREGRLPRSCTPERCEVLQIGGGELTAAEAPGVRLVRTGQADLRTPLALGPAFAPAGSRRVATPRPCCWPAAASAISRSCPRSS